MFASSTLLLSSSAVWAHNPLSSEGQARWAALVTSLLLLSFWIFYTLGCRRRSPSPWQALLFHGVTALSAVTLLGPLDDWAKTSTAAHMLQHMLLIVVIAPLWVLSRPLPQIAAATGSLGAIVWKPLLRVTRFPLITAFLHAAAIWFWHTPYFYMLAVKDPWWHGFEHLSFVVTGGVFWWAVLRSNQRTHWRALLAILFTLMHTGFLGALLTFSQTLLYGESRELADQQLAGLLMWVLGAVPYLAASAWVGQRWFEQLQRRMQEGT